MLRKDPVGRRGRNAETRRTGSSAATCGVWNAGYRARGSAVTHMGDLTHGVLEPSSVCRSQSSVHVVPHSSTERALGGRSDTIRAAPTPILRQPIVPNVHLLRPYRPKHHAMLLPVLFIRCTTHTDAASMSCVLRLYVPVRTANDDECSIRYTV